MFVEAAFVHEIRCVYQPWRRQEMAESEESASATVQFPDFAMTEDKTNIYTCKIKCRLFIFNARPYSTLIYFS